MTGPLHIDLLQHAIGLTPDGSLTGEPPRNHFAADHGDRRFDALVADGLAQRGASINSGALVYYHAADAGIVAARKAESARRRAAGLRSWLVSFDDGERVTTTVVVAATRVKAKYARALDLSDFIPIGESLRCMTARLA